MTWQKRRDQLQSKAIDEAKNMDDLFADGFDAGRADTLEQAEVLVKALEKIYEEDSQVEGYDPISGEILGDGIFALEAKDALEEWQKKAGE